MVGLPWSVSFVDTFASEMRLMGGSCRVIHLRVILIDDYRRMAPV